MKIVVCLLSWLLRSLSSLTQQQLVTLLETLSTTEPHYIRCVKPNNLLKPLIFENQNVLQQLRCGVGFLYFDLSNKCYCYSYMRVLNSVFAYL